LAFPGQMGGPLRRRNFNKMSGWSHAVPTIGMGACTPGRPVAATALWVIQWQADPDRRASSFGEDP
jgi:hypothetical protein